MATVTSIGPIGARQINNNLYVGRSDLTTIQSAVTAAVAVGSSCVVIPAGYAGSDAIGAVTGGNAAVYIADQRGASPQNYVWNGSTYIPADFLQAANAGVGGYLALSGMLRAGQINNVFYVTQYGYPSIQAAVDYIRVYNSGVGQIVISHGTSDDEDVRTLTGGDSGIYITDLREARYQNYYWTGSGFDFMDFVEYGNVEFHQNLLVDGNATIAGSLDADSATFDTCQVANSPVRTFANTADGPSQGMIWPPNGIPLSLGDHWGTSIAPASLATWPAAGIAVSTGTAWAAPIAPASFATWPATGIPVSTGSAWGTSIAPASLTPYPPAGIPQSTGTAWGTSIAAANLATWPAAGVPVSTGTAWGTPIAAANIPLLNQYNNFTGPASIGLNGNFFLYNRQGTPATPASASISSDGSNVYINSSTGGALFLNWDGHSGNITFGNGNGSNVGTLNSGNLNLAGNGNFLGTLTAGTKTFRIAHPLDETKDLIHGCLEGPEIAVYYRGEGATIDGWAEIKLPDYFEALTMQEDRTVLLTSLFEDEAEQVGMVAASRVKDGKFKVWSALPAQKFYWEVKGIRSDVEPLQVEVLKSDVEYMQPPRRKSK